MPAALVVPPAHAADEKSAVFSGGAACYLQPFFDEIRYKGVTRTEVGGSTTPRTRGRCACSTTRTSARTKRCLACIGGTSGPHALDAVFTARRVRGGRRVPHRGLGLKCEERKLAEQSRKVMEAAEVYGKNKKFLTEILDEKPFTRRRRTARTLYTADAKAYEKAVKKSGRARFFEKACTSPSRRRRMRGEDVRLRLFSRVFRPLFWPARHDRAKPTQVLRGDRRGRPWARRPATRV